MVVCIALHNVYHFDDVLFSFGKTPKSKKNLSLSDVVKQPKGTKATGVTGTLKSSQSDHTDDNKTL